MMKSANCYPNEYTRHGLTRLNGSATQTYQPLLFSVLPNSSGFGHVICSRFDCLNSTQNHHTMRLCNRLKWYWRKGRIIARLRPKQTSWHWLLTHDWSSYLVSRVNTSRRVTARHDTTHNHASIPSLNFYRPYAQPAAQTTASKH